MFSPCHSEAICGSDEAHPRQREERNMKLTCLLALLGLSSSLVISPPALSRAGMATRHRALTAHLWASGGPTGAREK